MVTLSFLLIAFLYHYPWIALACWQDLQANEVWFEFNINKWKHCSDEVKSMMLLDGVTSNKNAYECIHQRVAAVINDMKQNEFFQQHLIKITKQRGEEKIIIPSVWNGIIFSYCDITNKEFTYKINIRVFSNKRY